MRRLTTKVTYKVPDWNYCNCMASLTKPSKDKCRFCVKEKGCYRCALHNEPLGTSQGTLVDKCRPCLKASGIFTNVVEDNEVQVDPKDVMKLSVKEYRRVYKQLISQGYPDAMADTLAQKYVLND